MNRLWVRLTIAFAVVAVIGIGVAALMASLSIDREFRTFVAQNELDLENSGLPTTLVEYYEAHQSWTGVDEVLNQIGPKVFPGRQPSGPGQANNQSDGPSSAPGRGRLELVLADASQNYRV